MHPLNSLPSAKRAASAERKYAEAVAMYSATDLTIRSVAELCGVTAAGLSAHLGKHHRALLFARYGLDPNSARQQALKVKPPKGQSLQTRLKYKEAIEACGDIAYIEFNVSQVARMFGLDARALASQLRAHYPDIIPARERLRRQLGIADNTQRGSRAISKETYAKALEMYRDTDLSIQEVADRCEVSKGGFTQFLRFYRKDIIAAKAARRKAARKAPGARKPGDLAGNGDVYGPKPGTIEKYASALELFRTTPLTVDEIIERTGVPAAGFKGYLHQWHRGDKLLRRGCEWDGESAPDLRATRQFRKSTAAKYAPAIASLKERPRPVAEAAAEFGLNADVFRRYIKAHEPRLASQEGMERRPDGKILKKSSAEKYAKAIEEYATTSESLKSIAQRHGFVYNSICGYIMRNCPDARESHRKILENENQ